MLNAYWSTVLNVEILWLIINIIKLINHCDMSVIWYAMMWCDVKWCDVSWYDALMWFDDVIDVKWCDVSWYWCDLMTWLTWNGVMWVDMTCWCCDVTWNGVVWVDVMWCWYDDVIWREMVWCELMWCVDVMWCDMIYNMVRSALYLQRALYTVHCTNIMHSRKPSFVITPAVFS